MRSLLKDAKHVLEDWKRMPRYPVQEELLQTLIKRYPDNQDPDGVDLKVKCLNLFYSTGIIATKAMSDHIHQKGNDIDVALKDGNPEVVKTIAKLALKGDNKRVNYSFATKYCALHQPNKYPIYDSIVADVFLTLLEKGMLKDYPYSRTKCPNTYNRRSLGIIMRNYPDYLKLYDCFMKQYDLTSLSYREVDWYLWSAYKIGDHTYDIETLAPIKREIAKVSLTKK